MGKVAFIASVYRHFESFHLPYMQSLQTQGYEVHAYALPDPGKHSLEQIGVTCHDLNIRRSPFHLDNVRALQTLKKRLRIERYKFIHVHTPVASVLGRIAAKKVEGTKVIYTSHGLHFYSGAPIINWLLFFPIEHWLARRTDVWITMNEEDYERVSLFPVRGKVYNVPGVGLNIKYYDVGHDDMIGAKISTEIGLQPDDFIVICIAELIERKNHVQLIRAVEHLVSRGVPIKCLLVGSGHLQKDLSNLIREKNLTSHFYFLGYRQDIPDLLAIADVLVLLSKQEGLPRAIMEGMAAGKPIVTTSIRGNKELVIPGENGLLVPLNDDQATADALCQLYEKLELRNAMGAQSKVMVQKYELSSVLKEMNQIYQEVLN